MPRLHSLAAAVAASTLLCFATAAAVASPVTVNLRVESKTGTLYEGPITTDAKALTKDSSGPHKCDGTNGGVNPTPGGTLTTAMDDGGLAAGYTWDATWDSGFDDFFISRIGPDTNESSPPYTFWGFFRNWTASQVGGCQEQVHTGDNVLIAYSVYGDHLLQLTDVPTRAATGEAFQITVQDNDGSGTRTPASGATVEGQTSDAQGHVTLSFATPGQHTFKASRSGSVRSNAGSVCVYAPGSGDCGTQAPPSDTGQPAPPNNTTPPPPPAKDTTPPAVDITSLTNGKTYSKGPRELAGKADDSGGIHQVFLRIRATNGGDLTSASRCRWFSGKRGVFTHRTVPCSKARFFRIGDDASWNYLLPTALAEGKYTLDVKVLDHAYNAGRATVAFGVK